MVNYEKMIDKFKVVSFDIFDTLLLRPYLNPTDVFKHIELLYGEQGFAKVRVEAESKARQILINNKKQDVTLDEIYTYIPDDLKKYKEIELSFEKEILYRNEEVFQMYQYALSKNKQIYIISDIYISKDIIKEILLLKGYFGWDELFVSADVGLTKSTGDLYSYIKEKCNVETWLHIGDNQISDYTKAKENNITPLLYKQLKLRYLKNNKRIRNMLKEIKHEDMQTQLDLSIIIMLNAILDNERKIKNNPWVQIGEMFAGAMNYSFAKWVEVICEKDKIENALFVARDGYFLSRIFKKFNNKIKSRYFYISRKIVMENNETINEIYTKFFRNNIKGKYALIDVGTNNFTTLKFLKKYNDNSLGLYWCTGKDTNERYKKFYNGTSKCADKFFQTTLVEFFMTSPEPCIDSVDGNLSPQYRSMGKAEKYRSYALSEMEKGIYSFSNKCIEIFKDKNILQSSEAIIIWCNLLLKNPTFIEAFVMNKIYHAADNEHINFVPIMNLKPKKFKGCFSLLQLYYKCKY